jgi:hypothetical protein
MRVIYPPKGAMKMVGARYLSKYTVIHVPSNFCIIIGVHQGSVLGPVLYLLYINDLPTILYSTTATFANDTAVMAVGESNENSTKKLQSALNKIAIWTKKWRIKLNESKSVHIDFTNKRITQRPIYINGTQIPYANTAKYIGMTLDIKLRWKEHIKMKRDELNIKFRKMYWLHGRNSELSIYNKHPT